MPRRPRLPCSVPGCPELTSGGRCPKHEREAQQQRGTPGGSAYGPLWPSTRRRYLYAHQWCVLCGRTATVADHFPANLRQLVAEGARMPPAELSEPEQADTFADVPGEQRAVNARCREVPSREWQRVVPVLEFTAGIGTADSATLTDYCVCVARIDQCEREISANEILMLGERGWQKNGATTIVGQYRTQLARYIGELGLSPSARGRLTPPDNSGGDDDGISD